MTHDTTGTNRQTSPLHPYAERFEVHDTMPEHGVAREQILSELREMSTEEDRKGDSGRVSGSSETRKAFPRLSPLRSHVCSTAANNVGPLVCGAAGSA